MLSTMFVCKYQLDMIMLNSCNYRTPDGQKKNEWRKDEQRLSNDDGSSFFPPPKTKTIKLTLLIFIWEQKGTHAVLIYGNGSQTDASVTGTGIGMICAQSISDPHTLG